MSYEIYWGAGSPHSWRVLLGLEVKGLKYDSKLLEFSKQEQRSDNMLEMNPRGQLPVLKDGNVSIYESIAILNYLDQKHPDTPLFGSTTIQSGQIWQTLFEIENYLREPVFKIVRSIFSDTVQLNIDAINESAKLAYEEFKWLEEKLTQSIYLTDKIITAADIAAFPIVMTLLRALSLEPAKVLSLEFLPFETHYPNIAAWCTRIKQLPGYENAYPPNWKD